MAIKQEYHLLLTELDNDGNENIIYPQNTSEDVLIRSSNPRIPGVNDTLSDIIDRFGDLAFISTLSRENLDENLKNTLSGLEEKVEELTYVPINILSFTPESSLLPMGTSLSIIKFSWKLNKEATEIEFSGGSVSETITPVTLTSKSFTFATPITQDTTFTLTVEDEKGKTMEKTTEIKFQNYVYYGVSQNQSNVDTSDMTAVLTDTIARSFTVTAADNEYIYFMLPTRLGTPIFTVNSFEGGFIKVGDGVDKANSAGYSEKYDIWRSVNDGLGTLTIYVR